MSDPGDTRVRILGCPARDEADAVALEMVRHLLDRARYRVEVSGTGLAQVASMLGCPAPELLPTLVPRLCQRPSAEAKPQLGS